MKKIKIAQWGISHEHASGKISTLKKMTDIYEIVGYFNDSATKSAKTTSDVTPPYYDGLRALTEGELLNYPGLQAVAVETPNDDLVPAALRCMERGLAIHMDKPPCRDLGLFKKLLDGCEAENLPFQMGYMFRGNPAFAFAIDAVKSGLLGDIIEITCDMNHNYGGPAYVEYISKLQGGVMFNLGCHLLDAITSMMGRPDSVTAILKSQPGIPDDIKTNCLSVLEYKHSTVSVHVCSAEPQGVSGRALRIAGMKGVLLLTPLERFDGLELELELTLNEASGKYAAGKNIVKFPPRNDRYMEQFVELAKIINGLAPNPKNAAHDLLTHEIVLAASGLTSWKA